MTSRLQPLTHPVRWLDRLTGGGSTYALVVLFGLSLVVEMDRNAFGILLPEIRDHFGLGLQGVLTLVALAGLGALLLQVPIAWAADRHNRVLIAVVGAAVWGVFSVLTGFAVSVVMLALVRIGSALGGAVTDPTHNSLIADYYAPEVRPNVFSLHRSAVAIGGFVGPLGAGLIGYAFGWRVPFLVLAGPTALFLVLALGLREPVRGAQERREVGSAEDVVLTEEAPPSFAEGWRMVWKIPTLKRIWYALPFLASSLLGFVSLASLLYEQQFGLDVRARGLLAAGVEPAQMAGLVIGAIMGTRLMAKDRTLAMGFLSKVTLVVAGALAVFALAPNVAVAVAANVVITASLAIIAPSLLASLSLAIPPRARAIGFAVGSLWVIPGLLVLPVIGGIGDRFGIRYGMLGMIPVFVIGGQIIASAATSMDADIAQVWSAAAARAQDALDRREGRARLLRCKGLEVFYGNVQVLFDVDLEVEEGSIVALLGTNGAGKSTLLKAVSGVVEADNGAVIFDGREITHAPADEVAALGVVQMPGGAGVFGDLTVGENLRVGGWLPRRHAAADLPARRQQVLDFFPVLAQRLDEPAANLSGGQQQMLALGMAFLSDPRLLMIDELSLGLAPALIEQLLPFVRQLRDGGTTVILVEQSVNLALTIADTAYFMEKGQIRFHGPTAELLERPDVLRSVFLEGAGAAIGGDGAADRVGAPAGAPPPPEPAPPPSSAAPVADEPGDGSASDAPPALATVDVACRFGGIRAVDGVSLTVAPGEVVGVIGANGAGKTTLFDLISGFTRVESGRIELAGRDVTTLGPDRRAARGLGRSFQDAQLWPAMTVQEALAVALERFVEARDPVSAALRLPAVYDSEAAVRDRVDELIELMGLGSFRTKFVRELSTGSRRIVDLACLVAHRPTVVLLDEPSSGIAQRETEALAPLLLRIRDGLGAALLVIEHDMPLISTVADRLVAMDQGRVIADGPAEQVLHDPRVVASYLGGTEEVIARSGQLAGT